MIGPLAALGPLTKNVRVSSHGKIGLYSMPLRHAAGEYRHMEIGTSQAKQFNIGTMKGKMAKISRQSA